MLRFKSERFLGQKCGLFKEKSTFIMKVTSFHSLASINLTPKPSFYPLTLTRFLMFKTTYVLRNTIELFFFSISLLQLI